MASNSAFVGKYALRPNSFRLNKSPLAIMIVVYVIICALIAEYLLKRRLAGYRMALFRAFAVVCILATIGFWFKTEADSNYIATYCERAIERNCDPLALQAWAVKVATLPNGFSDGPVRIHQQPYVETNAPIFAALPHGLYGVWKHQYSPHVSVVEPTGGGERFVYLFWGSGVLGHWGMTIGSPAFVAPPSGDKMRLWKPGVYFWRDCH
jgi:hypothetical protein